MLYFGFTWDDVKNLRVKNTQDATLFNIELLTLIRNKFPERKVIFLQTSFIGVTTQNSVFQKKLF